MDVAVDLVALTIRAGELCALLVRRARAPYEGCWALPGGFAANDEDLRVTAARKLRETGVAPPASHLEQLQTYGAPCRDPRRRVISVAYLAVVADTPPPAVDSASKRWRPVDQAGRFAFDHSKILADGVERARTKLEYTSLATDFCAAEFTIPELHAVYEAVWSTKVDVRNFHRKVTNSEGFLRSTGSLCATGGRRANLYTRGDADVLYPPLPRPARAVPAHLERGSAEVTDEGVRQAESAASMSAGR